VREAIREQHADVGGRTVELSETEFMVRGKRLSARRRRPRERSSLRSDSGGVPVRVRDVARVELGPDERRGITELERRRRGRQRHRAAALGANALDVIDNVKAADRRDRSKPARRGRDRAGL
jgi:Cu(I)/Ag(I) efflux system membrane protein CusA/SilA